MRSHKESELAGRIGRFAFGDLFEAPDQRALDALWEDGRSRPVLESLVADTAADWRARFLAAEILFTKLPGYPPAEAKADLAAVYAAALRDVPNSAANPWGLPGTVDGPIARHVLELGDAAVHALGGLLEDTRLVVYEGSKEATFGNSFHYRVKDIAAALIARIRKLPIVSDESPAVRDSAIQKLMRAV